MVTSLTKDQPNPIFFCMGHGAHKSSRTGPISALQMFSGPRYRAFSGKNLGGYPGTRVSASGNINFKCPGLIAVKHQRAFQESFTLKVISSSYHVRKYILNKLSEICLPNATADLRNYTIPSTFSIDHRNIMMSWSMKNSVMATIWLPSGRIFSYIK